MVIDSKGLETDGRLRKQTGNGYWLEAGSIAELAEQMGVPADSLQASIDTYNAAVNGAADPFGAQPTVTIDAGPFYAVQVQTANHMTKGGLGCNEYAQAPVCRTEVSFPICTAAVKVTWQSGGYSHRSASARLPAATPPTPSRRRLPLNNLGFPEKPL